MDQWLGTYARQGDEGDRGSIYRADQDGLSLGALLFREWMEDGLRLGHQVYYLNFQFDQLPGPTSAVLQQMRSGIIGPSMDLSAEPALVIREPRGTVIGCPKRFNTLICLCSKVQRKVMSLGAET